MTAFTDPDYPKGYQGWPNWETWSVALWCDNTEPVYRDRMNLKPRNAHRVEAFVRRHYPDGTPDMQNPRDPRRRFPPLKFVSWEALVDHWSEDYEPRTSGLV